MLPRVVGTFSVFEVGRLDVVMPSIVQTANESPSTDSEEIDTDVPPSDDDGYNRDDDESDEDGQGGCGGGGGDDGDDEDDGAGQGGGSE